MNNRATDSEGITVNARYKFSKNSVLRLIYLNNQHAVSTGTDIKDIRYTLNIPFNF